MQAVSSTFSGAMNSPFRQLDYGVLVSWNKATASGINYFTIGQSKIGGNDPIAPSNPQAISNAAHFQYTNIPASGVVSWQTSMRLDQYPYGLVLRQADIVLNNAGTQFLPASGTAYGPYQIPNRPVEIVAGFNQETIPMFTGFSDAPVSDIRARTTTLHCYDAMSYINAFTSVGTKPFVNVSVGTIISTLMGEMGFSSNQYVLENSLNANIPYLDPYGQLVGQIFQSLCEAEAGIMFADEAGIVHFWNRQHLNNNATPVWTLTYSNMENLSQQTSSIINFVEIQSSPLALLSGVQNVYSLNQPYYIQAATFSGINAVQNPSVETNTAMWTSGIRQNGGYVGNNSISGAYITYSGVPVRQSTGGNPTDWGNAPIKYNGTGAQSFAGRISAQVEVFAQPGAFYHLQLVENQSGLMAKFYDQTYSGNGSWQNVGFTYDFNNYGNAFSKLGDVTLAVSGTNTKSGILVDAFSDDMALPYFDGNTAQTKIANYAWSGSPNNSASYTSAINQYLAIQVNLNAETFSLVQPVASGLNASNIGATQSFFSFSSLSGVGGIYGTDLTASMSLRAYSVSGTTAFLIWQNAGTQQAFLTNLVLYGQTAASPAIGVDTQASDATSINLYGLNPSNSGNILSIANNFVPNPSYANTLAQYLVGNYKTPMLRHVTDNFVVPPLQFGDAVTLVNRDTGERRVAFCLGLSNSLSKNADFKQQLIFQERGSQTNYFTIGISSIGGTSQIAP